MKIAICISGQLRGNEAQWRKIVEKFSQHDCDFYLSIWDKMGGTTAIDRVIPSGYLSYFFSGSELKKFKIDEFKKSFPIIFGDLFSGENVDKNVLSKIFNTKNIDIESSPSNFLTEKEFDGVFYPFFLQERNPRDINCILMFYKIWSCFQMVKKSGISYDCVIRLRSDLDFGDWDGQIPDLSNGILVKKTSLDEHMDDQFAIGKFSDMNCYSNLWESLKKYWKEPRDDSSIYEVSGFLLRKHLRLKDVNVVKMDFPFTLTLSRKSKKEFLQSIFLELSNSGFSNKNLLNVAREMFCDIFCDSVYKKELQVGLNSYLISNDFIKQFKNPSFQLLGFLAERMNKYELSISYYHQAISEDFKSFISYSGLARVHQKLENTELAISAWNAALGVRPDNWVCMRELAKNNLKIGRYLIAKYWIDEAKNISKSHHSVIELENLLSKSL